jgi:hypothetical protein
LDADQIEREVREHQIFGHVGYTQWSCFPHVAGSLLRAWKWTAAGVVVPKAINILKDAPSVAPFVHLVASGPYSQIGPILAMEGRSIMVLG